MFSKCKKLGAVAAAALAVGTAGVSSASASPYMMMNKGIGATSVTSAQPAGIGLGLKNNNINIGSYQQNGTITSETDKLDNLLAPNKKTAKLGMITTQVEKPSLKLGVDAMAKIAEAMEQDKFNSDVDAAFAISAGRRSPYGSVGCAETVTYAGSYYSPALKDAFYKGIAYVPSLLADLSAKGYAIEPFNGFANKGDLLVYGDDDHVVIADGKGGCFGNSSSRLQAMHYSDAANAWNYGQLPSKVVRMSNCE